MTKLHGRRCGAAPPSAHVQRCDKPPGHAGPHRGYVSDVDAVEYWAHDDDPREGAPAPGRRTRGEDEA